MGELLELEPLSCLGCGIIMKGVVFGMPDVPQMGKSLCSIGVEVHQCRILASSAIRVVSMLLLSRVPSAKRDRFWRLLMDVTYHARL